MKTKETIISQLQFLSCESDTKKMWKLINNLLGSKAKELSPPDKFFDSVNLAYTCTINNGQHIQ